MSEMGLLPLVVAEACAHVQSEDHVYNTDNYKHESNSKNNSSDDTHYAHYCHTISSTYAAHLPEALQGLTWQDDFFDDDFDAEDANDIVAVFDLDYPLLESYNNKVGWSWMALGFTLMGSYLIILLGSPVFVLFLLGIIMLPHCYWLKHELCSGVRSLHIAVTRYGILYVRRARPPQWGIPCTARGKMSKTVPFDIITDCDIMEYHRKTFYWIPTDTLNTVRIQTAHNIHETSNLGTYKASISGLKNPYAFKQLVWAMKRLYHPMTALFETTVATMVHPPSNPIIMTNDRTLGRREEAQAYAPSSATATAATTVTSSPHASVHDSEGITRLLHHEIRDNEQCRNCECVLSATTTADKTSEEEEGEDT